MRSLQAILASDNLRRIGLRNHIASISDTQTEEILQALAENTSIQEADLKLNWGGLGIAALTYMLLRNTTLKRLEIFVESLEDNKCKEIAEALRGAIHLNSFCLSSYAKVSRENQDLFISLLRCDNMSLTDLDLRGSEESEEQNSLVLLNKLGRRALLQNLADRERWIDALVGSRHDLYSLFYLMNANPALCDV